MNFKDLSPEDQDDLNERWRAFYQQGSLATLNREEVIEKTIADMVAMGLIEDEIRAKVERSTMVLFGPEADQHPFLHRILEMIEQKVDGSIHKEVPFLLLPELEYEAFATALNSGRLFVGISQMMLTYPLLLSELLYNSLESVVAEDASKLVNETNGLTVLAWHLNAANHELAGYTSRQSRLSLSPERGIISMAASMVAFMVLHELAHIYLGHTPSSDSDQLRRQEFEADSQAAKWWFQVMTPRTHWDYPSFALATMFRFFSLADKLRQAKAGKYPSWDERFAQVRTQLSELGVPTEFFEATDFLFAFAENRAMRTSLFSLDEKGELQVYANPAGTLEAFNAICEGSGEMIMLMIDPEGKCHERDIDMKAIEDHRAKRQENSEEG